MPVITKSSRAGTIATIGLGLPSLVLGLAPLFAPHRTAPAVGVPPDLVAPRRLRLIGTRETLVAVGFIVDRRRSWIWAFLAQDLMDLPLCLTLAGWRRRTPRRLRAVVPATPC